MANQAPNKGMLWRKKRNAGRLKTKADRGVAQERLTQVADHMSGGTGSSSGKKGKAALLEKNPDDVSALAAPLAETNSTRLER